MYLGELLVEWICEADVAYDASLEEGEWSYT
jgi:hypothetical protein